MSDRLSRFGWIVTNSQGNNLSIAPHPSFDLAEKEAISIAKQFPSQEFTICKIVGSYEIEKNSGNSKNTYVN